MEEKYFELGLPEYLKNDIGALENGKRVKSSVLDCLYNEVYGSINSAYFSSEITEEQARYLRKKYLGI